MIKGDIKGYTEEEVREGFVLLGMEVQQRYDVGSVIYAR